MLFREEKNTAETYEKCSYPRMKILKSLALMRKKQPDQEILQGHYFIDELDADSQTGWKGQTYETAELLPFPKCKGETFILS